jgi:hypothetical protein
MTSSLEKYKSILSGKKTLSLTSEQLKVLQPLGQLSFLISGTLNLENTQFESDETSLRFSGNLTSPVGVIPDKITITNVLVRFAVQEYSQNTDNPAVACTASVQGDTTIAGKPLGIWISITDASQWKIEVVPNNMPLPSLSDLCNFVEMPDLFSGIQACRNLIRAQQPSLTNFAIGFNFAKRAVTEVSISVSVEAWKMRFLLSAKVPDFTIYGSILDTKGADIKSVLTYLNIPVPPNFPVVSILDASFKANIKEENVALALETEIDKAEINIKSVLTVCINLMKGAPSASLNGQLTYKDMDFSLDLELSKDTSSITATAQNLQLSKVVKNLLKQELPKEVPDFVLETLTISIDTNKNITIQGKTVFGDKDQSIGVENFTFPLKSLQFDFSLIDKAVTCSLTAFVKDQDQKIISVSKDTFLNISDISFTVKVDNKSGNSGWELSGNGILQIKDAPKVQGFLSIGLFKNRQSLIFTPKPSFSQKLTLPCKTGGGLSVTPSITSFGITKDKDQCSMEGAGSVQLAGLPKPLQDVIAKDITCTLLVSSEAFKITIDRITKGPIYIPIVIPPKLPEKLDIFHINKYITPSFTLGTVQLDVTNFSLSLLKQYSVSVDIGITIPETLNKNIELVTTIKDLFATTPIRAEVAVNEEFVSIDLIDSPLSALKFSRVEQKTASGQTEEVTRCDFDIKDFGKGWFTLPKFIYYFGKFKLGVQGTIQRDGDLSLPLGLVKKIMSDIDMGALAKLLPDRIPFTKWSLDGVIDAVKTVMSKVDMPSSISTALDAIKTYEKQLPDSFTQYLNIELPETVNFDISTTTDGSFSFYLSVVDPDNPQNTKPVKLLYPLVQSGVPVILGIKFKGIGFGELWSGTFFSLKVDMDIDVFDLPTLAVAANLPSGYVSFLPDPKKICRTIVMDNVFILIFFKMAGEVPVFFAVPIFFDDLGVDYVGIEGLSLGSHWLFPEPTINLFQAFEIIAGLVPFLLDKNDLLKTDDKDLKDILKFTVGPNYLDLPEYLGGREFGSRDNVASLSGYTIIAEMLNALKTKKFFDIVPLVPEGYRFGSYGLNFGPVSLSAEAKFAITTSKEFQNGAYKKLDISESDVKSVLSGLPQTGDTSDANKDKGVIVLFKGEWAFIGSSLEGLFGMAYSDKTGFQTGVRISGDLGNLYQMDLTGNMIFNPAEVSSIPLQLNPPGTASTKDVLTLSILNNPVFRGNVVLAKDLFQVSGSFQLFPDGSPFQIKGTGKGEITKTTFSLALTVGTSIGKDLELAGASGTLSNTGISISGKWLAMEITLSSEIEGKALQLTGSTNANAFSFGLDLVTGSITIPNPSGGTINIGTLKINSSFSAPITVTLVGNKFSGTINGSFSVMGSTINISVAFSGTPADLKALEKQVHDYIISNAESLFSKLFEVNPEDAAKFYLKLVAGGVLNMKDSAGKVLKDAFGQTQKSADELMNETKGLADDVKKEVNHFINFGY